MKKSLILCLLLSLLLTSGCVFEDEKKEVGTGIVKVTVNTSAEIWSYPKLNGANYEAYSGDTSYTWQYTEVCSSAFDSNPKAASTLASALTKFGTLANCVSLYSALGDDAKTPAVVYKGVNSSTNNSVITITGIAPGTYYVVAYYDYSSGNNTDNLLTRYDRYAIYTDSSNGRSAAIPYALDTTSNSTMFVDKAAAITIGENQTVEITLQIGRDWVLGKPKPDALSDTGRVFLKSTDPIPTP